MELQAVVARHGGDIAITRTIERTRTRIGVDAPPGVAPLRRPPKCALARAWGGNVAPTGQTHAHERSGASPRQETRARSARYDRGVAVTLNHASVQASDPERAALGLATITGGSVAEFHPVPGAFVCFLNGADWDGGLIEFYPRTVALANRDGAVFFRAQESQRGSGGTHFNLTVPRTRESSRRSVASARSLTRGAIGRGCSWSGSTTISDRVCAAASATARVTR